MHDADTSMLLTIKMAHSHTAIGGSATPNHELFELVRLLSVSSRSPPIDADELLLSEDGGDLTSTATSSATSSASGGGGGGGSSTSSSASQQTGSATTSSSSSNQPPPKRSFFRSIGLGKKSPPLPSKEQHAGDRGGSSSHHDSSSSNARGDGALSSGPSTGGSGAAAAASDPRTAALAAPCTIVSTASAGTPSYYFIALFVSTSYFVFRYLSLSAAASSVITRFEARAMADSGVFVVRRSLVQIRWSRGRAARQVSSLVQREQQAGGFDGVRR